VCTELTRINDPGQDGETLVITHSTLPYTGRSDRQEEEEEEEEREGEQSDWRAPDVCL